MFGLGKKKCVKDGKRPEDYETRPVKMVQISENVYKIVWADEKH